MTAVPLTVSLGRSIRSPPPTCTVTARLFNTICIFSGGGNTNFLFPGKWNRAQRKTFWGREFGRSNAQFSPVEGAALIGRPSDPRGPWQRGRACPGARPWTWCWWRQTPARPAAAGTLCAWTLRWRRRHGTRGVRHRGAALRLGQHVSADGLASCSRSQRTSFKMAPVQGAYERGNALLRPHVIETCSIER
jgi:hypothetical protein